MRARRRANRVPRVPKTMWHDFLYGPNGRGLVALAAVLAAIFFLNESVFRPVYTSGPPPFPSRAEVDNLRTETTEQFKGVKIGIDQTLELAKAANIAAQQSIQESRVNRLSRLLQQSVQLQALIEMNPNDLALRQVLEQTKMDIQRLSVESRAAAPAITPIPIPGEVKP